MSWARPSRGPWDGPRNCLAFAPETTVVDIAFPARSKAPADGVQSRVLFPLTEFAVPAIVPSVMVIFMVAVSRTIVEAVPVAPAVTAVVT